MASNGTIAHRFANKDYNYERGLKGSSTHISGKNYYSYSTVFGQWVDEKVCLVYQGSTSKSSSKHQLGSWDFPKDIVLLPYDDGGRGYGYYSWHGCDLLGWSDEFSFVKRMILMKYYADEMFDALKAINGGKKKHLESLAARTIEENWKYIVTLVGLYKDTSVPKFLKYYAGNKDLVLERRMLKAMHKGTFAVPKLVDIVFGKGTWQKYYDYCARYRKGDENKQKTLAICRRLGIKSPYNSEYYSSDWMFGGLSTDEIRKLTAKQRNDIHFAALMRKELYEQKAERKKKYERNRLNAYKWIVGCEPTFSTIWNGEKDYRDDGYECRNMFTGQVYDLQYGCIHGYYWLDTNVNFYYDEFRNAENKEEWIREFYAKCQEVQDNVMGLKILKRVGAHTHEKVRSWDDDRYIDDEFLRENTTEEEYALAKAFIDKCEKHLADEEARKRAEEIERIRREEEERKEREYMAQVKQEQIDECLMRGVEGCRDLWRKHLQAIDTARLNAPDTDDAFFYHGNVLLRLNLNKDKVETSKGIRIPVEVCKKMWKIVSKWHENPSCFKPMEIDTKGSGRYTISSYRNDILTAGCHDIAYAEMERMYNEIIANENNAA